METIKVLFLAAEADPLVKVGGLGDVAGSLPRALMDLPSAASDGYQVDVRLVLPFHAAIHEKYPDPEFLFDFEVPAKEQPIHAKAYQLEVNGVHTYLIDGEPVEKGAGVYSPDAAVDGPKYIFFSLAALELIKKLDWQPHILHANDWHTALAVYVLKQTKSDDPLYKKIRSVLTIHNLPFMGAGTEAAFDDFGLAPSLYPRLPTWARKFPLPLGLQTADRIVAVSPTYAREILGPEYGCGLEKFLSERKKVISGIINGLDTKGWDPETDARITANFDTNTLANRKLNKAALLKEFSLNVDPKLPLLIMISRMDPQKGVDLVLEGLSQTIRRNWQAILLGTGDMKLEKACKQLEAKYPDRIRAAIRFDSKLAARMYAGADLLLMPSRYEPCGLAQMIAMRYGCVPLAHSSGGLQDTIVDIDANFKQGTGFLFKPAENAAFVLALLRALDAYRDTQQWAAIQKRGMSQDFSWAKSALQYLHLYKELI